MDLAQREFLRAHRLNSPCAVLMLDLDDLKWLNDTFGHSAGDEALQLVAHVLAKNVRAIDVVARYGGDEFVVLMQDCEQLEARQIAARLQKESRGLHLALQNRTVEMSFSLGIAVSTLMADETLEKLLGRADTEMYQMKTKHKDLRTPRVEM
jgi:diguanylate cyclase